MNEQGRKELMAFLSERRDMWRNDKNLCELRYKGAKYLLQHHKASLWSIDSNVCDMEIVRIDKEIKELSCQ